MKIDFKEIIDIKNINQQLLNKLNNQDTKLVTGFNQQMPQLGPRLQKINPETLELSPSKIYNKFELFPNKLFEIPTKYDIRVTDYDFEKYIEQLILHL